jgi:hypothetical protein
VVSLLDLSQLYWWLECLSGFSEDVHRLNTLTMSFTPLNHFLRFLRMVSDLKPRLAIDNDAHLATAATTSYSDARSSIDPPGNNYPPVLLPESAPQRPFSQSDKVRAVISQPLNQNHPRPSTSQTPTSVSVSTWPLTTTEALTEHADRGPLLIARSASDRLPPAYGEKN